MPLSKVFTPGEVLVAADVNTYLANNGYQLNDILKITSSTTFEKADYPWLKAIKVKTVGAGGGGAGAPTTGASETSLSRGGSGGGYSESFITDIAGLDSSITVTIGAGGLGGAAGQNNGNAGGSSSFGTAVIAAGGGAGISQVAGGFPRLIGGLAGAAPGTGDITLAGGCTPIQVSVAAGTQALGASGKSIFGGRRQPSSTVGGNGANGETFGEGGTSGQNDQNQATARTGGDGANGVVIIELYA